MLIKSRRHPLEQPIRGPSAAFLAAVAATFAGMGLLGLYWPAPLLLPAASLAMLAAASAVAAVALLRPAPGPGLTYWDVSGALTLAGICAALLSEPEQVIPLIENASRPRVAQN
ncbi:MAG: hypothetical protein HXY30_20685 [Pseudorhodoplanes sp.]|nr:hypothetical protein [Pseudorhodoplanes sp.]